MKHRILFIVFLSLMNISFLFSHDKNVLSRSVQAPNAVYNLELGANIKSVHELTCAGIQSSSNFNVKNTGNTSFRGFFIVALTDENGNFKYNLTSVATYKVRTIDPNFTLSYESGGIYVPNNALPGTYRLRMMYRENTNGTWKVVANGSFSSIQTVKIANSCDGYNLELGANIKSVHELTCAGIQSSANFDVKNTGNTTFSGYLIIALTDENDNFKYNLGGGGSTLRTIAPNSSFPYTSVPVYVPADMIPGTYRLRMMYRENTTDPWKAVANGAFPSIQVVNIINSCYEEKHNLELGANIKSVHELTCAGIQSSTNFDVKNTGNTTFNGYLIIALTDENDNFKYNLGGGGSTLRTIAPNSSFPYTSVPVYVPADMIPGTYRLRMMYRENTTDPWKAVANGAFTSIQVVNIINSCYEEKHNLELGANIKSVHELTCAGIQSSANFDVKNTGNTTFSGYLIIALTDENDNFKYNLGGGGSTLRTIAPNSSFPYTSVPVYVPADMIPGTYRLRIMYKENISDSWKAVPNGSFPSIQTVKIINSCYEKKYNLESSGIIGTTSTPNDIKDEKSKLSIYPNPVTDILYISSKESEIIEIALFDFTGNIVIKNTTKGNTISIPVQHLSSGMYILKIKTTNGSYTHNISKQ